MSLARILSILFIMIAPAVAGAQALLYPSSGGQPISREYTPLQELTLTGAHGSRLVVTDGAGHPYVSGPLRPGMRFRITGALGEHTASILDQQGRVVDKIPFKVVATTAIDDADGGRYKDMFDFLYKSMCVYSAVGADSIRWHGSTRHYFVSWGLDNYHTLKGMQYFSPYGNGLVDIMSVMQRKDGMIWSFIASNKDSVYFKTAYGRYGFYQGDSNAYFVRQPTENHVEYIYVNTIYKYWKGSGNDEWMKARLGSAERALDYSRNDSLRWSARFGLLKRPLTIDSWDFQVDDEYTPQLGVGNSMLIEYGKTKFGVFYGDNTGYAQACNELGDMFYRIGDRPKAEKFHQRGAAILQRLNALAWNGRFFTHFIDEDSTVIRHLGVDMRSQLSQSNAYSLNRGLSYAQDTAIINTYLDLKEHLPPGSPGEWYAIYPPFQRGFTAHDAVWQYMNGGVGGHVAGELALGALEQGYEQYGVDILDRLTKLGKENGDRVSFAYTGSFPAPAPAHYKTLDLAMLANMDLWDKSKGAALGFLGNNGTDGNDLHNFPPGDQVFNGIPFHITDPEKNQRRSIVALSSHEGYLKEVKIPVNDSAAAVYLLHDANGTGPENVCASITFEYTDDTRQSSYILKEKHLSGWWFPYLQQDNAGVAWSGPNAKSVKVGAYWAAIANPRPGKKIRNLWIHASADDAVYTLLAVTLSDQPHYVRPKVESFGGPDNWAAATAMAALIEGVAGAGDDDVAYRKPVISPRWIAAGVDSIRVTVRYAASDGYISYLFVHDKGTRRIRLSFAGNADEFRMHVLLPEGARVSRVDAGLSHVGEGPASLPFRQIKIGASSYVDFVAGRAQGPDVMINY